MKDYSNYYSSSKSRIINNGRKLFEMHLNGFDAEVVLVNGVSRKLIIEEKYSAKEVLKKVIDEHGFLSPGDVIRYSNRDWLIRKIDKENIIYDSAVMEYSPSSLKWIDEDGEIQDYPFIFNAELLSNFGIESGKVISYSDDRRNLAIKNDVKSKRISLGQRFIFDDAAWKVISINRLNPLIEIIFQSDQFDEVRDSKDLRIANYYGKVANYTLEILNGKVASIKDDDEFQVNVEVKNNGVILDNPNVTYLVSDPDVATIDQFGRLIPIKTGSIVITVQFKDLSSSIEINITGSLINNTTAYIAGEDSIKYNMSKSYMVEFKNNGLIMQDRSNFWITAVDGVSSTNLASIISQDSVANSCLIKANSTKGNFILHVENHNQMIYSSKTITVKSIL